MLPTAPDRSLSIASSRKDPHKEKIPPLNPDLRINNFPEQCAWIFEGPLWLWAGWECCVFGLDTSWGPSFAIWYTFNGWEILAWLVHLAHALRPISILPTAPDRSLILVDEPHIGATLTHEQKISGTICGALRESYGGREEVGSSVGVCRCLPWVIKRACLSSHRVSLGPKFHCRCCIMASYCYVKLTLVPYCFPGVETLCEYIILCCVASTGDSTVWSGRPQHYNRFRKGITPTSDRILKYP